MKNILSILALLALATVSLSTETAVAADKVVVVPLNMKKCSSPVENSYTNSAGMTFNLIPTGTFIMGSPPAEPGRGPDETQHQVTLTRSYYIQTTEVTNKQWNDVVVATNNGFNPSTSHTGDNYPVEHVNWFEAAVFADLLSASEGLSICYNGNGTCTGTVGVDFTCTSVIIDPNCTGYRLSTEAEWEYAARAGTTTAYANPVRFDTSPDGLTTFTEFNSNLDPMGWYVYNNSITAYANGTKPVALKQAN